MTDPFAVVPIQINLDPRLTFRDVKVLIALLSFRNGRSDETVWPTRRALSERCNLPEQRISAVTTRLVSLGWLTKTGKGGFSRSTRYDVTIPVSAIASVQGAASTVTDSVTVTESVTVTKPVTSTVTESVTGGVTESVTRKEVTILSDQRSNQRETPAKRSARGTRLEIESLPVHWRSFIVAERPDLDPLDTWNRFHDYWVAKPGKDGVKTDWLATWRNWVRREEHRSSGRPSSQRASISDRNRSVLDAWASDQIDTAFIIEGDFRRESK